MPQKWIFFFSFLFCSFSFLIFLLKNREKIEKERDLKLFPLKNWKNFKKRFFSSFSSSFKRKKSKKKHIFSKWREILIFFLFSLFSLFSLLSLLSLLSSFLFSLSLSLLFFLFIQKQREKNWKEQEHLPVEQRRDRYLSCLYTKAEVWKR